MCDSDVLQWKSLALFHVHACGTLFRLVKAVVISLINADGNKSSPEYSVGECASQLTGFGLVCTRLS